MTALPRKHAYPLGRWHRPITDDERASIVGLYERGAKVPVIAETVGRSFGTVAGYLSRLRAADVVGRRYKPYAKREEER